MRHRLAQAVTIGPTVLFVGGVLFAALAFVVDMSITDTRHAPDGAWSRLFGDPFVMGAYWTSIRLSLLVTLITLVIAYPTAWYLARLRGWRLWLSALIIFSPVLVSVVVRTLGWLFVMQPGGMLDELIGYAPLYRFSGVLIALVHIELPYAVFTLFAVFRTFPVAVLQAARDLGASPWRRFTHVVLPMSVPGLVSAAQIVFALTVSAFATPTLLGGGRVNVLPYQIYSNIQTLDWPLAAAQALLLLATAAVVTGGFSLVGQRWSRSRRPA